MENKSCSTCKERKIACDRATPICKNCLRSKRSCQRHRIRLSWPRGGDRKRAIVLSGRSTFGKGGLVIPLHFINTTSQDVETYRRYVLLGLKSPSFGVADVYIPPPTPSLTNHAEIKTDDAELIPFFFSHVLPSLPAFDVDFENLRGVITRFAIFDDSALSQAVLNSLMALAANSRFGNHKRATKYIAAALKSLRLSMEKEMDVERGLQQIVASMLICSFEMYGFSQTSSIWILYLSGTKSIVKRISRAISARDQDQATLLHWVYYYDTLANVGIQHWRGYKSLRTLLEKELGSTSDNPRGAMCDKSQVPGFSHNLLQILFDINSITEQRFRDSQYHMEDYISWLEQTEQQLLSIRQDLQTNNSDENIHNRSESVAVKKLFIVAVLLYFERQAKRLTGPSTTTDSLIEEAFSIMSTVEYCNKPFPLLIFGREPLTDDQRLVMLQLIDRSIAGNNVSNLGWLKSFLLKLWVQNDLGIEEDVHDKNVCSMLKGFEFVPCLL